MHESEQVDKVSSEPCVPKCFLANHVSPKISEHIERLVNLLKRDEGEDEALDADIVDQDEDDRIEEV